MTNPKTVSDPRLVDDYLLTIRDQFAAAALTGILASHAGDADLKLPTEAAAAKWAYEYADAMLRHRQPPAPVGEGDDQ